MNRINSIDYSKAIAITLVVVGHIMTDSRLIAWIYSFHMPLFFILSGYTLVTTEKYSQFSFKGLSTYIPKKYYEIFVPFLLYALIFGSPNIKSWIYILYGTGTSLKSGGSNPVLWFLPCFFITSSFVSYILCIGNKIWLSCRISKVCKYTFYPTICIIAFATGYFLHVIGNYIPVVNRIGYIFSFDVAFIGLGFMLLSMCITMLIRSKMISLSSKSLLLTFSILFLVSIITFQLNLPLSIDGTMHIDMRESIYGNFFLFVPISVIGSYSIIYLGLYMENVINRNRNSFAKIQPGGGIIDYKNVTLYRPKYNYNYEHSSVNISSSTHSYL